MENTIENAQNWIKENQSKYPNVIKSNHWAAQILFDYAQQLKILNIPDVSVSVCFVFRDRNKCEDFQERGSFACERCDRQTDR